jgi:hypothetical protein
MLNYGEGALQPGAIMAVYSKGAVIRDPSSGEVIGSNESKLGLVRITEIVGRMSKAMPATAFGAPIPVGSIVRPASTDDIRALAKPAKRK